MTLRLERLHKDDLPRVAHIQVAPEQIKFSGTVAEAFEKNEENIDLHAILERDHPVGFFKIDTAYSIEYPFATAGSLGLRAFMIDRTCQGRGIASQAVRLLPQYLSHHYPARDVYLTVNKANPAAIRCYLKGGFIDTGGIWTKGSAGPQHIMHLPCPPSTCP
ncbi:GNAT family protein [Sulfitobacter sp. F26169L]|uniref:GNAT family N-acetyltransferase n=1 Tax=Sulfitobacter sp. F26169L TaxID=2996015 RepID=UPI002260EFAF|nr:GNAT family protein [Sulfitobacter sp. F26169L]MCX7566404.1 GNAT family protein [Sulfitobacter sp. F26169L]